jgi:hypothetical protein
VTSLLLFQAGKFGQFLNNAPVSNSCFIAFEILAAVSSRSDVSYDVMPLSLTEEEAAASFFRVETP